MSKDDSVICLELYNIVNDSLSKQSIQNEYKKTIDLYLSVNSDKYITIDAPLKQPIFSQKNIDDYINLLGLQREAISNVIKKATTINKKKYMINSRPFSVANCLATRYALLNNNKELETLSKYYIIVSAYPTIYFKYFKYEPNEACMAFTINHMSQKFHIRQYANLWKTLTVMADNALIYHEEKIKEGTDLNFANYVQEIQTRLNALIKNIAILYYDNYNNRKYLSLEHESFDENNYYESENDSYIIKKISDKVTNYLIINGPDMQIVALAAKTNNVSRNTMRNYINEIITSSRDNEIYSIIEALLFLYLFERNGSVNEIKTNKFLISCLEIYGWKSTASNKNISRIKQILDKWLIELNIVKPNNKKTSQSANYRKAFYSFLVFSIQKLA